MPAIPIQFHDNPNTFNPYKRDAKTRARPWAIPGTPGLEHRIGSLERDSNTGNISYDANNHHDMIIQRQQKITGIANDLPPIEIIGKSQGELLVISWGSTFGAVKTAVEQLQESNDAISMIHLRYLYPFQNDLQTIIKRFKKIFVPELNTGQLNRLLCMEFLVDTIPYNKITGQAFSVEELIVQLQSLQDKK